GGDCCECTCELPAGEDFGCIGQFACVDPDAACVDDDSVTVDMLENCANAANIGDGYCSEDLNKEECAYDGGDCCSCTCEVRFSLRIFAMYSATNGFDGLPTPSISPPFSRRLFRYHSCRN
ncbi:unnamed protein product, partial [Ectocarpus sp. 12 AP-2014]